MSPRTPPEKPAASCSNPDGKEPDDSSWAADQKQHDYYYDDSHGYEDYVPDEEDLPDEKSPTAKSDRASSDS